MLVYAYTPRFSSQSRSETTLIHTHANIDWISSYRIEQLFDLAIAGLKELVGRKQAHTAGC
jgi:hypothetical protein